MQDKLGPVCRSVADCAVIFDILRGQDNLDPTSREAVLLDPFQVDISRLTVGYIEGMEDTAPEVSKSTTLGISLDKHAALHLFLDPTNYL